MFISMLVIFGAMALVTRWWTGGWTFVSPENLSNLSQQVTQTGILAIGMTMVILISGIDLSVGAVLAFSAVVLALFADPANVAQVVGNPGLRVALQAVSGPVTAILLAVAAGAAVGAWNGFMISRFKLLPFVVTLATLTMARGLAYLVSGSQSLTVKAGVFRVLGVYSLDKLCYEIWYRVTGLPGAAVAALEAKGVPRTEGIRVFVESMTLPDRFPSGLPNPAKLVPGVSFFPGYSIVFLAGVFAVWAYMHMRSRAHLAGHGHPVESDRATYARIAATGVGFAILGVIFASHQGIPVMVILFAALAAAASFTLNQTVFGRHLYAIGGNKEAARLAGVEVSTRTFQVFLLMGVLSAVSGIMATSRAQAASPATQGVLSELEAIAAVVVGGTSLMGGVGTIGGTVIGVLIIGFVVNGMILMALPNPVQLIFKGLLIMIAVLIDMRTKARK
jgi:putative multiple sugar transport system permease protein